MSPIIYGGGGGAYSPPVTRDRLAGNDVSVANYTFSDLTWDVDSGPDSLLNITIPASPTLITAGVYAVAVQVVPDAQLTVGGYFTVGLHIDALGDNATVATDSAPSTANNQQPFVAASLVYYCPAGGVLEVEVGNLDGVSARNFMLFAAIVQRLS